MPSLRSLLNRLFAEKKWCASFKPFMEASAAELYAGESDQKRPAWWCITLAYTNPEVAKNVLVMAIQNEAALLPESELKTQMAALSASMTTERYSQIMAWALPRRQGSEAALHAALYGAAKFLRDGDPELIPIPIECLIRKEAERSEVTIIEARSTFQAFLYSQVDFETWKGGYTE
jgi:hypothetical protein